MSQAKGNGFELWRPTNAESKPHSAAVAVAESMGVLKSRSCLTHCRVSKMRSPRGRRRRNSGRSAPRTASALPTTSRRQARDAPQ
eukprot:1200007-Lingulodinium_polyedra.AAC.1